MHEERVYEVDNSYLEVACDINQQKMEYTYEWKWGWGALERLLVKVIGKLSAGFFWLSWLPCALCCIFMSLIKAAKAMLLWNVVGSNNDVLGLKSYEEN